MRVVIWRNQLLPWSETFILNQLRAFSHTEVVLAGLEFQPNGLLADAASPIAWTPRWKPFTAARSAGFKITRSSRQVREFLETTKPDLIHAHFGFDAVTVCPVARRLKVPLVATFHGIDVTSLHKSSAHMRLFYGRRLPQLFRDASLLIAVSDFIAERLLALGAPPHKVKVHHIGIPIPKLSTSKSSRRGIIFVGRLVEKKGVPDLLRAVSLLPSELRQTPVSVLGDGPLRQELQELSASLQLNVAFMGRQTPTEVQKALESSAIFVAPSKTAANGDSEGFGMVFAEAAAAGVPTISYAHGGVVSAVQDGVTGLLVPEGDISGLALTMEQLLGDSALAVRLGSAGRARASEEFNVQIQSSRLEEIYEQVVRGSLRRP